MKKGTTDYGQLTTGPKSGRRAEPRLGKSEKQKRSQPRMDTNEHGEWTTDHGLRDKAKADTRCLPPWEAGGHSRTWLSALQRNDGLGWSSFCAVETTHASGAGHARAGFDRRSGAALFRLAGRRWFQRGVGRLVYNHNSSQMKTPSLKGVTTACSSCVSSSCGFP